MKYMGSLFPDWTLMDTKNIKNDFLVFGLSKSVKSGANIWDEPGPGGKYSHLVSLDWLFLWL